MTGFGYSSLNYCQSFERKGLVLRLAQSGAAFLERDVSEGFLDLIGIYPFIKCKWPDLVDDLIDLDPARYVSSTWVADPLFPMPDQIERERLEVFREYKRHYCVDLTGGWDSLLEKETRRLCRRALERHDVLFRPAKEGDARDFSEYYQFLVNRHDIRGISAVDDQMLELQMSAAGAFYAKSFNDSGSCSVMLVYVDLPNAYFHLLSTTPEGYKSGSNYALFFNCLSALGALGVKRVNIGGNAGLSDDPHDGLSRFKRKWATASYYSYLCGFVHNFQIYNRLVADKRREVANYFPAYRAP